MAIKKGIKATKTVLTEKDKLIYEEQFNVKLEKGEVEKLERKQTNKEYKLKYFINPPSLEFEDNYQMFFNEPS